MYFLICHPCVFCFYFTAQPRDVVYFVKKDVSYVDVHMYAVTIDHSHMLWYILIWHFPFINFVGIQVCKFLINQPL